MPLTEQELIRRLEGAANALRGPVEPADFKSYVFPMLFWKWVSDTWDYEHAQAEADYGDALDDEIEADYHRFTVPAGTHWRDVTTKTVNLGAQIGEALGRIEQANPDTLAGIFGDVAWANTERLPETSLLNMLNEFQGLSFNPEETPNGILGRDYEYLLKDFTDQSGKRAAEFLTLHAVVRLLVQILNPHSGESVYDPACGSGGMLVETIATVRAGGGDTRTLRLYGQEASLTTSAVARMNLYLHDIEDFKIVWGDTPRSPGLRNPDGTLATFDVVVGKPPFPLKNWGAETWSQDSRAIGGVPPRTNADWVWVQHMLASMTPGTGRVGVVMPHGVLFRGAAEARIREAVLNSDQLEAVIGLPNNLFHSISIPACLLIFRGNKPPERKNHVLFIDGSARFTKCRNQNDMTEEDITTVLQAYRTGDDPDGGAHVRLVPLTEIGTNGWDLSIGHYIKAARSEWRAIKWGWILFWMAGLLAVAAGLVRADSGLAAIAWMASTLPIVVVPMNRAAQVLSLALFASVTAVGGAWALGTSAVEGRVDSASDYASIPIGLWVSALAIAGYAFYAGEWGRQSKAFGAKRRSEGTDVGVALGAICCSLAFGLGVWIVASS